jgi:hypothetical protein
MHARHASLTLALAVAFAATAGLPAHAATAAAPEHSHAAHTAAPARLTLDHGKRWATDAPLRAGMDRIRALVAPKVGAIHGGKLGAAEYQALGVAVEKEVADIVAQCKLPPEADAVTNGGWESSDLTGWTGSGMAAVSAAAAHTGRYGLDLPAGVWAAITQTLSIAADSGQPVLSWLYRPLLAGPGDDGVGHHAAPSTIEGARGRRTLPSLNFQRRRNRHGQGDPHSFHRRP